jgi:putative transposase
MKHVQRVRMDMPRVGTRKLHYLLKTSFISSGVKIGRDALFSYLRREHMLIKPKRSYTKTTHSKHWLRKHPNLYTGIESASPEEYFVSDITYIKSREKTHYLSLVTDDYSRKIMGYHLSDDMSSENVAKALKMAVKNKKTSKKTVHHSDRGLQYCSSLYQDLLSKNRMTPSMTDGYDCYQNALAERINGILKQEYLFIKANNGKDLKQLIDHAVDSYNNRRPHSSLNFKTPNFIHEKTEAENPLRSYILS